MKGDEETTRRTRSGNSLNRLPCSWCPELTLALWSEVLAEGLMKV